MLILPVPGLRRADIIPSSSSKSSELLSFDIMSMSTFTSKAVIAEGRIRLLCFSSAAATIRNGDDFDLLSSLFFLLCLVVVGVVVADAICDDGSIKSSTASIIDDLVEVFVIIICPFSWLDVSPTLSASSLLSP